jgi:hypothetical protein
MSDRVPTRLGFWGASIVAVLSGAYLALLAGCFATAGFAFPPRPFIQAVAGLVTICSATAILVVFAVITHLAPREKATCGTIALSFSILFVAMVSINRFVQLAVIRLRPPTAQTADLARFLPYSTDSVVLALEILGWGFFLSIACLFVAPLFSGPPLQRSIRWLFVLFALFALTSLWALPLPRQSRPPLSWLRGPSSWPYSSC